MLLRVPGFGVKTVDSILSARRFRRLTLDDLGRLRVSVKKVKAFIVCGAAGRPLKLVYRPVATCAMMFAPPPQQMVLLRISSFRAMAISTSGA